MDLVEHEGVRGLGPRHAGVRTSSDAVLAVMNGEITESVSVAAILEAEFL
jgi:hypothetical protein